jgi:MFS superfamily sulfate permease-like transporter
VTAAESLHSLNRELEQQGIALKIAHANRPLRNVLERIGLADELGQASFFHSVHECIEAFHQAQANP